MRVSEKLSISLVISPSIFYDKQQKTEQKKESWLNFLETLFISSFSSSSSKFSNFDAGNVILFQIKIFGSNIKETAAVRFFIKVTARPSLRNQESLIRGINGINQIRKQKICYKASFVSPSNLSSFRGNNFLTRRRANLVRYGTERVLFLAPKT